MRRQNSVFTMLVGLAVVVATVACGKSEEKPRTQAQPAAPQASPTPAPPASTTAAPPPAPPAPAPATPAPASPAPGAAAAAIAATEGEMPGTRVEVQELKRSSGGSVTLRFSLINSSDKPIDMYAFLFGGDSKDTKSVAGVTLVDPVGKKKYFVLRDTEGACLCSRATPDAAPSARLSLWAKYPAPPDNVAKISVIIPHFAPMDDVPLGR